MIDTRAQPDAPILTNEGRWSALLSSFLEDDLLVSREVAVKQVQSMMVATPPDAALLHELVQVLKQKNTKKSYIVCNILDQILDTRVPLLRHHETLQSALQQCMLSASLSATAIQTICQFTAFCALNGERIHVQMVPKVITKIIAVVEQNKGDKNVQLAFLHGVQRLMTVESIPWRNQTKLKQMVWSLCFHETDDVASPAMMALCKLTWLVNPEDKALIDEIVENSCTELDTLDVGEWSQHAVRHLSLLRHLLRFGGSSVKHMGDWKNTATKQDCVVRFPSKILDLIRKLARHALYPSDNREVHLKVFGESLRLWCVVMQTLGRGSVLMFNQRSFIRDLFSAPNDAICLPEWVQAIECVLAMAPGFFVDRDLVHLGMRCFVAHIERAEVVSFVNVMRVLAKLLEQVGVLVKAEDASNMVEALSRLVWVGVHKSDAPGTKICQDDIAVSAIFDVLAAIRLAIPIEGQHIIFVLLNLLSRTTRGHDLKQQANKIWRQFAGKEAASASAAVKVPEKLFTHSVSLMEPAAKKQRIEPVPAYVPAPVSAKVVQVPVIEAKAVPEPVEAPKAVAPAVPVEVAPVVSAEVAPAVTAEVAPVVAEEVAPVAAAEVATPESKEKFVKEVTKALEVVSAVAHEAEEEVPASDDDISLDLASPDQSDDEE